MGLFYALWRGGNGCEITLCHLQGAANAQPDVAQTNYFEKSQSKEDLGFIPQVWTWL